MNGRQERLRSELGRNPALKAIERVENVAGVAGAATLIVVQLVAVVMLKDKLQGADTKAVAMRYLTTKGPDVVQHLADRIGNTPTDAAPANSNKPNFIKDESGAVGGNKPPKDQAGSNLRSSGDNSMPQRRMLAKFSPGTQEPSRSTSERSLPDGNFTTRQISPSTSQGAISTNNDFSISKSCHKTADLKTIMKGVEESKEDLDNLLKGITNNVDGTTFHGTRLKDGPGIVRKLNERAPNEIADYLGGRIFADSRSAADTAVDALRKNTDVIKVDDHFNDIGHVKSVSE